MKMNHIAEEAMTLADAMRDGETRTDKTWELTLDFVFRWPVKMSGPNRVSITLPMNGSVPVINPEFVRLNCLSDAEAEAATKAILRSIAILPNA